jgi:sensor histidine kinase YesM
MKKQNRWFAWDRYIAIEIAFFIFVYIGVPFSSNIEYGFKPHPELQSDHYYIAFVRSVVWGLYHIIPIYLLYKLAIQQLLIKKRYGFFLLACVAYVPFLEWYTMYFQFYTMSKLTFLPDQIVAETAVWLNQKHTYIFGFNYHIIELLELAALGYYVHYQKQEKQIRELKRIQTEADLQYLKAQLQPHFFFNTLNNIYSLALQRSELTAPLVAKLSDLMRYVLYEAEQPKVPLVKETDFLSNYIDVQSVRYNEKIAIRFDTQGITDAVMIEPLLLLPFIENAFKHGTEEEEGEGFITIIISLAGEELTLSVSNSKSIKINEAEATGIGIGNTEKRLQLLYPNKHTLAIRQTEASYTVLLSIILN